MSQPLPLFSPTPRARKEDPETSHTAAESVKRPRLRLLHWKFLELLAAPGTDSDLIARWRARWPSDLTPESSIRTRRHELVDAGFLRSRGVQTLPSGRRGLVWERFGAHP